MLESLINPKRAEKGPWKMLPIGILYGSLSLLLVKLFFSGDPVLSKFSGLMVVTFCVMFSLPFMIFIIRQEEKIDEQIEGFRGVWTNHKDAIYALIFLFVGFVIAFSFWFAVLGDLNLLNAQIETYCMINSPGDLEGCVMHYTEGQIESPTGQFSKTGRLFAIIENNIYVLIFTLIFSLIFGAGAIFILAWNASVIAGAIGIFANYKAVNIPIGFMRYMIHGIPEIGAYFITALAGGILGAGMVRNGIHSKKFYHVLENVAILIFFALVVLLVAGLMEVYLTPMFF
ncbi:MAG: stage II sporulation protein M [Nanoarchaeota archaeon]|nr:stage II sporulation protein M [Nanoarchaeota archaeon]